MKQAFDFLSKEPIFNDIITRLGFPTIPKRPQGFATLVLLILEQQVSIDSAKATFNKIKVKAPDLLPESANKFKPLSWCISDLPKEFITRRGTINPEFQPWEPEEI